LEGIGMNAHQRRIFARASKNASSWKRKYLALSDDYFDLHQTVARMGFLARLLFLFTHELPTLQAVEA
jgi:hypothetical protein